MYVLTLGSTDLRNEPIATATDIVQARYRAVTTLHEILMSGGDEKEFKTVRLPSLESLKTEVYGNIHVGLSELIDPTEVEVGQLADWIYVTDVPEVVAV